MPSNTKNPIDDLVGDLHCTHKIFAHPSFPPAGCLAAICFTTATPESQIGTLRCQINIKTQDPLKKFMLSGL